RAHSSLLLSRLPAPAPAMLAEGTYSQTYSGGDVGIAACPSPDGQEPSHSSRHPHRCPGRYRCPRYILPQKPACVADLRAYDRLANGRHKRRPASIVSSRVRAVRRGLGLIPPAVRFMPLLGGVEIRTGRAKAM